MALQVGGSLEARQDLHANRPLIEPLTAEPAVVLETPRTSRGPGRARFAGAPVAEKEAAVLDSRQVRLIERRPAMRLRREPRPEVQQGFR